MIFDTVNEMYVPFFDHTNFKIRYNSDVSLNSFNCCKLVVLEKNDRHLCMV